MYGKTLSWLNQFPHQRCPMEDPYLNKTSHRMNFREINFVVPHQIRSFVRKLVFYVEENN